MNKFIGIGRITKDIELKYTQSSKAVAQFTLAVDKYPDDADFINCVVWEKQAENLKKYCTKGSQIAVEGHISTRSYDNQDGKKVYVTEVIAEHITFLDSKPKADTQAVTPYSDLHTRTTNAIDDSPFAEFGENIELDESDIAF
jgi:single-strand DNA-binding protein